MTKCPHCGKIIHVSFGSGTEDAIELRTKDQKKDQKKVQYGDFVKLTVEEYDKLTKRFGKEDVRVRIERLDNYIGSVGRRYKSHYHTILSWSHKDTPAINTDAGICNQPDCKSKGRHERYGRKYCLAHLPL